MQLYILCQYYILALLLVWLVIGYWTRTYFMLVDCTRIFFLWGWDLATEAFKNYFVPKLFGLHIVYISTLQCGSQWRSHIGVNAAKINFLTYIYYVLNSWLFVVVVGMEDANVLTLIVCCEEYLTIILS